MRVWQDSPCWWWEWDALGCEKGHSRKAGEGVPPSPEAPPEPRWASYAAQRGSVGPGSRPRLSEAGVWMLSEGGLFLPPAARLCPALDCPFRCTWAPLLSGWAEDMLRSGGIDETFWTAGRWAAEPSPLPPPGLTPRYGRACAPVLCPIVRKAPMFITKGDIV